MMDLFLTNTQLFTSQDINWWTGVLWITCGLLWCFYQLFGLSFWRHPFTAEDPLVSKWCNATFLQTWWRNKLIYILDELRLSKYSANLHFGGNYFFIMWRPLQEFPINLFLFFVQISLGLIWAPFHSSHIHGLHTRNESELVCGCGCRCWFWPLSGLPGFQLGVV